MGLLEAYWVTYLAAIGLSHKRKIPWARFLAGSRVKVAAERAIFCFSSDFRCCSKTAGWKVCLASSAKPAWARRPTRG